MSSAIKSDPGTAYRVSMGYAGSEQDTDSEAGPTIRLSTRQQLLDMRWRRYRCSKYEGWKFDWNGQEEVGPGEHDNIVSSGVIPPGFYDAGGQQRELPPLKFRKPSVPFHLERVIVNRFTSLLFSNRRHPTILSEDARTQDWLDGFCEATRFWVRMAKARAFGGATGSWCVGFKFVDGKPFVEVHDPRWVTPIWKSREQRIVKAVEIMYQWKRDVRNDDGEWEEHWYWYRRVIDEKMEKVWARVPVEGKDEPDWDNCKSESVDHGFGECPVVFLPNIEIDNDIDGDPDFHGIMDMCDEICQLWSSASKGTKTMCEPTPVVKSELPFASVVVGSSSALQVKPGEDVELLEMTGAGVKSATDLAEKLEEKALTVACCVLDRNEGGPSRTATEVEHNYSAMIDQADTLREQYGEGIKRLLSMVVRAARLKTRKLVVVGDDGSARHERGMIVIPPRKVADPNSKKITWVRRELGSSDHVDLQWPDYFTPSQDAVKSKVDVAATLHDKSLADPETIARYIAKEIGVEDVVAMLGKIAKAQKDGQLPNPASPYSGGGVGYTEPGAGGEDYLDEVPA